MVASVLLRCSLFSHPKLVTREKQWSRNDLLPNSELALVLQRYQWFFLGRFSSVKMSRTDVLSMEVLILFFSCVVTTPHHRFSVAIMAWNRWSNADDFWALARGANTTDVHLARLVASVKKTGLDVHDIPFASGYTDVLGYEVSPAKSYCSGTSERIARSRSVARTVTSRQRNGGRAMELVNGHESFLALSNRGALSILDASFNFAGASYLVSGELLVNCVCGAKSTWKNPTSPPQRLESALAGCLHLCGWFAVGEGCRELASEVGRVSVRTRFKGSSRSIRARSRALRFNALDAALREIRMRCRLLEGRVAQTSRRCRCSFWTLRNGSWRRTVVSSARRTS